jgi:hypothetical protein
MKKATKIGLIVVASVVGLLIIAAVGYRLIFSQGVVESFEVNSSDLDTKVLIATQGSGFKDALVSGIIEDLKKKPIYIKVVDVTTLSDVKEDDWNVVVLISTCQSATLQPDTATYLDQAKDLDKTILLITSGSGTWKPENSPLDSISSASKKANVDSLIVNILNRLNTTVYSKEFIHDNNDNKREPRSSKHRV